MAAAQRNFHLTFCDNYDSSLQALRTAFEGIPDVAFAAQDIRSLHGLSRPSAFCSAGNSFGIMDGGVDWGNTGDAQLPRTLRPGQVPGCHRRAVSGRAASRDLYFDPCTRDGGV